MALKIDVTWPSDLGQVCIPINCEDVETISRKATKCGDSILIKGAFGESNRVCDDDRYRIHRLSISPLECCTRLETYTKTMVIVLESPHKDEYFSNFIDRPIAPALGKTGHNIQDHLMDVIHSCPELCWRLGREVTRVIIANPIQYQASLAALIRTRRKDMESKKESNRRKKQDEAIRDAVWKELWCRRKIRDEFNERLDRYGPDFIINACTHDLKCTSEYRGRHSGECRMHCRKQRIRCFLRRKFTCARIYVAEAHPVNWHNKKRRGLDLVR